VVATAAVAAVGLVVGPLRPTVLLLVASGTAWAGHRLWRARGEARARSTTRERVLETCDLLVAELGAGQPPEAALARAADAWPQLAPVAQASALGGDVPAALRLLSAAPGADGLALVAAAWVVAHRTGHGLADALGRLAESLRQAAATDRVVQGELASARATARLVGALPAVALAMGAGSGGDPVGFLLGTPVGLACLAGGLLLGFVGLAWIERIAAGVGT
jgi:tight adherence protein B